MPKIKQRAYNPIVVTAWMVQNGLPEPVYEYAHIPGRGYALDIAWPTVKIGIEVQGGTYGRIIQHQGRWYVSMSGHNSPAGLRSDREKHNLGIVQGWQVLQIAPQDLLTVDTLEMLRKIFQSK